MAGAGLIWAVLRRPRLWGEAVRAVATMTPRAWWTRRPPLPLPESTYLAWRRQTAYGSSGAAIVPRDVIAYLEWRRCFRRSVVRRGVGSG